LAATALVAAVVVVEVREGRRIEQRPQAICRRAAAGGYATQPLRCIITGTALVQLNLQSDELDECVVGMVRGVYAGGLGSPK